MAELYFTGGGAAFAQVTTITMSGAGDWIAGDTVTVTISGMDVIVTVGANDRTDSNIATAVKDALAATAKLDGTGNTDATSNIGGQEIPEFTEITFTVATNVVTATGKTKGKPFTMTVTETVAGDETATEATTTAATGPNHANLADNWSTGSIPAGTDDVVFDGRASFDCLYGLNFSSVALNSLTITNGFRKTIGLPEINTDSTANPYPEYRDTYLQIQVTTLTIHGDGGGSERIKIDLGSATATTADISANGVKQGSQNEEAIIPVVLLKGTNASNILRVTKGSVGMAFFDAESAHFSTLHVGPDPGTIVQCGDGVDLTNATVTVSGGTLSIDSTTSSGTIVLTGGTLNVLSSAHSAITARNGTVNYLSSGTLTTLTISKGGIVSFSSDQSRTVTNVELFEGYTINDAAVTLTVTNGYDFNECPPNTPGFNIGKNLTLTPSAI